MAKGPLITRSELRKRQQAQASESLKNSEKQKQLISKKKKRLPAFIVKKAKRINQSRKQGSVNEKRRPNGTLF